MEDVAAGHHERGLRVVGVAADDAVGVVRQVRSRGGAVLRAQTRLEARVAAQTHDALVDRLGKKGKKGKTESATRSSKEG